MTSSLGPSIIMSYTTSLFVSALLLLAMAAGHSSAAQWCACKGLNDAALQKTLDYACGAGADCNPIRPSGPCYNPNTVRAHCNYAVNSYFQRKGQAPGSCDFSGTAAVTTSDPSYTGCVYPSTASSTTGNTPGMSTPTTPTTSTTTPVGGGGTPLITNPGVLGGNGSSFGPNTGMNPDISHGGTIILISPQTLTTILVSGLISLWP